eukprot:CAMPEP_0177758030 /NCGR_PEP_ID=MMETSP0491_2-20121128/3967_1 /TAXON_ID=63592 /ORGANISM="Tetraselmis chuii, Strain PLY429" /LENGTH=52 /DNA_ID=CAMNT_0019273737 /DNA_START=120 /DNA_END=278 /DNA_ORIENTATION=+
MKVDEGIVTPKLGLRVGAVGPVGYVLQRGGWMGGVRVHVRFGTEDGGYFENV